MRILPYLEVVGAPHRLPEATEKGAVGVERQAQRASRPLHLVLVLVPHRLAAAPVVVRGPERVRAQHACTSEYANRGMGLRGGVCTLALVTGTGQLVKPDEAI
eukprot:1192742-Prorocentrum_minimum.AAC.1